MKKNNNNHTAQRADFESQTTLQIQVHHRPFRSTTQSWQTLINQRIWKKSAHPEADGWSLTESWSVSFHFGTIKVPKSKNAMCSSWKECNMVINGSLSYLDKSIAAGIQLNLFARQKFNIWRHILKSGTTPSWPMRPGRHAGCVTSAHQKGKKAAAAGAAAKHVGTHTAAMISCLIEPSFCSPARHSGGCQTIPGVRRGGAQSRFEFTESSQPLSTQRK